MQANSSYILEQQRHLFQYDCRKAEPIAGSKYQPLDMGLRRLVVRGVTP